MIGRSILLKVTAFAVITVVGVSYVLLHYIGVGKALFGNGTRSTPICATPAGFSPLRA